MPSVISGEKGKEYFKKIEDQKESKELEKQNRMRKREEAKVLKEREKAERKQKVEERKQTRLNQMEDRRNIKKKKSKHIIAS